MFYEHVAIGAVLFVLGGLGIVFNRSNLIIMLMSIELMLLAIYFLFFINSVIPYSGLFSKNKFSAKSANIGEKNFACFYFRPIRSWTKIYV